MNYWRIGCRGKYFDGKPKMLNFFAKRPFVWGKGVSDELYLPHLAQVKSGDILVAGGAAYIDFIGRVINPPKFIPELDGPGSGENLRDASFYEARGISTEDNEDFIKASYSLDLADMVCIETEWLYMDRLRTNKLQFPIGAGIKGFQKITNAENIKYISDIIGSAISGA